MELQGDGFLLAFQSARQALLCAVAMQRAFARYSEENAEEPIRIRIGIHTGEALRDADKFFGKTVILAARIDAQAEGGEILVSSLLKQLTEIAAGRTKRSTAPRLPMTCTPVALWLGLWLGIRDSLFGPWMPIARRR